MITTRRANLCLMLTVMVAAVDVGAQRQTASWSNADRQVLVWNQRSNEPLFVKSTLQSEINPGLNLVFRERDFSVSLLQPLSFSTATGYFVWWVTLENQTGLTMICFRRDSEKQFHASRIIADLQDLGELKQIKTSNGSSFLFAVAGDGELRLVSATTATSQHLFIDYTSTGQVERIRDDFARDAIPQYEGEQVRRLTQTWVDHGNKYLTAAILK